MVTVWFPDGMSADMTAEEFKNILLKGKKTKKPRKYKKKKVAKE